MEKAYAQALVQAIENGTKPHEAVASLKRALEAKGRIALLPRIARALARMSEKHRAGSTMTLTVARQKDAKQALKAAERLLADLAIGETDLCEEIDESLIGGWRLEGRGVLVDNSWKKSLLSIYNQATQ